MDKTSPDNINLEKEFAIDADMPVMDESFRRELESGQIAMANELFALFIKTLPSDVANINQAHRQQDFSMLKDRVHHLHGASCYCGVPRLKKVVSTLETVLLENNLQPVDLLVATLNREVKAVQAYAEQNGFEQKFSTRRDAIHCVFIRNHYQMIILPFP